jgi:hypothetical protein
LDLRFQSSDVGFSSTGDQVDLARQNVLVKAGDGLDGMKLLVGQMDGAALSVPIISLPPVDWFNIYMISGQLKVSIARHLREGFVTEELEVATFPKCLGSSDKAASI